MKKVKIENAVGEKLSHDIVEYGPKKKRVLFEKGHRLREEDIEKMKDSGNYMVFVSGEGEREGVHENDAALRMAEAAAGENLTIAKPKKGRVRIISKSPGLLEAKSNVIKEVNLKDQFIFAFKRSGKGVKKREEVASVKLLPLFTQKRRMREVEKILRRESPVIDVVPPKVSQIGLIVTGTEVYEGRIKDAFKPIMKSKMKRYGLDIAESATLPDDKTMIKDKISEFEEKGFDLILVTGGMAVDSIDVTPSAIMETGAEIISRGIPIFPGNMLMVAKLNNSKILGIPACVLPDRKTSFDLILPKILAGKEFTQKYIAELGEGGLL